MYTANPDDLSNTHLVFPYYNGPKPTDVNRSPLNNSEQDPYQDLINKLDKLRAAITANLPPSSGSIKQISHQAKQFLADPDFEDLESEDNCDESKVEVSDILQKAIYRVNTQSRKQALESINSSDLKQEEPRQRHEKAKKLIIESLKKTNDRYNPSGPLHLPQILKSAEVKIGKLLNPYVFDWKITEEAYDEIIRASVNKKANEIYLFGIPCWHDGTAAPNGAVLKKTDTTETVYYIYYKNSSNQGAAGQLALRKDLPELINEAAKVGFSTLYFLNDATKKAIQNGCLCPNKEQVQKLIEELRMNYNNLDYHLFETTPPDGKESILFALDFATVMKTDQISDPEWEELLFFLAYQVYRMRLHQAVVLNDKRQYKVFYHPRNLSMENTPSAKCGSVMAKAFYQAGKELEDKLTKAGVQVRFQLYKEHTDFNKAFLKTLRWTSLQQSA
jgi:hypothetical protein